LNIHEGENQTISITCWNPNVLLLNLVFLKSCIKPWFLQKKKKLFVFFRNYWMNDKRSLKILWSILSQWFKMLSQNFWQFNSLFLSQTSNLLTNVLEIHFWSSHVFSELKYFLHLKNNRNFLTNIFLSKNFFQFTYSSLSSTVFHQFEVIWIDY